MKPADLALPLINANGIVTPLSSLLAGADFTLLIFLRHLA